MPHPNPATSSRSAGILLHITSLPAPHGIGDLGPAARAFINQLAAAKLHWWQILPLNPTPHDGCPYAATSAFAANPLLISLHDLQQDNLLQPSDLPATIPHSPINFPSVEKFKSKTLTKAWHNFQSGTVSHLQSELTRFQSQHSHWLNTYALFAALREAHHHQPWWQWPRNLARRNPRALAAAQQSLAPAIARHIFWQFLFYRQYAALKSYAHSKSVRIIGDLPIFVSANSADVWADRRNFKINANLQPRAVAGCPPDAFCDTGQLWGNPVYNWPAMKRDRYSWWIARLQSALELADIVRIDHFRDFAAAWEIPASAPNASFGKWIKAPGADFFTYIRNSLGNIPVIAEDLGYITPDVEKLRDQFHLPGMRVLQFGFEGERNPHAPQNHIPNSVVYTGTHDNDTTEGWWRKQPAKTKRLIRPFAPDVDSSPSRALIRLAFQSPAQLAIIPMQDILALPSRHRMNTPGTTRNNWRWRMREQELNGDWPAWLKSLITESGRN